MRLEIPGRVRPMSTRASAISNVVKAQSMSAWGSPDRYIAITDAPERRRPQTEDLIAEIVNVLAVPGEFAKRIDLEPAQRVVELKWAARQAGRHSALRLTSTKRSARHQTRHSFA
jgi:hypothetical protein